jgi:hypothetical protein
VADEFKWNLSRSKLGWVELKYNISNLANESEVVRNFSGREFKCDLSQVPAWNLNSKHGGGAGWWGNAGVRRNLSSATT